MQARFFINALAEPADIVAAFLVPRVRAVPTQRGGLGGGAATGTYIQFLTKTRAATGLLARLVTGRNKARFVPED